MSKPPAMLTKPLVAGVLSSAQSWARVQGKWWGLAIRFHVLGLVALLVGTVAIVMNAETIGVTTSLHAAGPTAADDDEAQITPGNEKKPMEDGGVGSSGSRKAMVETGGTKATERAVGGGLNWLARHQNADGSWSFDSHSKHCKDATCTCGGENQSNAAATAFALLPFLAAGQTHTSKGPYQKTMADGMEYMGRTIQPDGNLQGGVPSMYAQGIATITLCETYGLTKDETLKAPAQMAVEYICRAQHPELGGWHYYLPGGQLTPGDLSVTGWQLQALKSAELAGLDVPPVVWEKAQKYLKSVSKGKSGGLSCYMPETGPSPTMTSVGMLGKQFLGTKRDDPALVEGTKYLMGNMLGVGARNSYYFYYATQAMHNQSGKEWDEWNRAMRKSLVDSQEKQGCAMGSWNPELPKKDAWCDEGGRLLNTSLSTLTLEVYYKFLSLYKLDQDGEGDAESETPNDDH